jgi:IS1 family transposase
MDPAGLPALEEAIRHLHGAEPSFVESVPVRVEPEGRLLWDGEVQVFDLAGHPSATRCYAWSYATEGERRQFVAVLHVPQVESPEQVLNALVEGVSVRATERMTDVSIPTVLALLVRVGEGCENLHDVMMRGLPCEHVECDEIWSYVAKKQRHVKKDDDLAEVGDTWTWVSIDAETKLIPAYRVGKRDGINANAFIADLASRLRNKIQISTDGLSVYEDAIELAWGADVDYAQVIREYEAEPSGPGRYSPPKVMAVEKRATTISFGDTRRFGLPRRWLRK